jgi:hypothetical protein
MIAWQDGWPHYSQHLKDDYPAIIELAEKVSNRLKIDMSTDEGCQRLYRGVTNIARYCSNTERWACKNIYYANLCFQNLSNEIEYKWRMAKIKSDSYNYKK